MSWVGSKPVDVYLGLAEGGFAIGGQPVAWSAHEDVASAAQRWFGEVRAQAGSRLRRPRVRIWLSGGLARPFVWGPVQGLASWREVELAAQAAAPEATGLVGPCVVELDAWPSVAPRLVVAIEQGARTSILDAAWKAGVRMTSMRPWWASAIEQRAHAEPPVPALAASDTDALTVLAMSGDDWQMAHSVLPLPSAAQTMSLLDRLLLGASLDRGAMRHATLMRNASAGAWPRSEVAA